MGVGHKYKINIIKNNEMKHDNKTTIGIPEVKIVCSGKRCSKMLVEIDSEMQCYHKDRESE